MKRHSKRECSTRNLRGVSSAMKRAADLAKAAHTALKDGDCRTALHDAMKASAAAASAVKSVTTACRKAKS